MKNKQIPFFDLHEDLMLHIEHRGLFGDHWQTNFEQIDRSGVRLIVATAFPEPVDENYYDPKMTDEIEGDFLKYLERCEVSSGSLRIVKGRADLQDVFSGRRDAPRGLILHIEGLNTLADRSEDWAKLEYWYAMGWRSVGIVWNISNAFGGGTNDPSAGLTELGEKFMRWAVAHRMIIDLAHMNKQTFDDTLQIVQGPVVISHGNARVICDDPRNYTDEQLKRVAASGGLAGVFFSKKFVVTSRDATIDDVVRHIDHLRNIMGIDHVGIGTDFGGITSGFPGELKSVERMSLLWNALSKHGYDDESIEKIAYKNALRVIGSILEPDRGA